MKSVQTGDGLGNETLSTDVAFTMLSNGRRRQVLHYLKQRGERVTVRELSRRVAAWENGVTVDELDYKQRKRVYTSLHQTHLPKLAGAGVVDYDRDRGTVALGRAAAELTVYMEVVPANELPWSEYYLGLSALSLAVAAAAWLGVFPLALVPGSALAGLIAAAFAVSAGVQWYRSRATRVGASGPPPSVAAGADPRLVLDDDPAPEDGPPT